MSKCIIHMGGERRQGNKACNLLSYLWYQSFMAIADHGMNTGQRGDLLRRPLSVTSGYQDARGGVFPVHSAQEGAGSAIGLGGHAAGVGYDHIGPAGA
jgi:hypothetical protein